MPTAGTASAFTNAISEIKRTPRGQERTMYGPIRDLFVNWLRVLRSADTSPIAQGVRQQRHTKGEPLEKCEGFSRSTGVGMRLIAMFFGPHAPREQTAQSSGFSHYFKRLERLPKLATSSIGGGDIPVCSFLAFSCKAFYGFPSIWPRCLRRVKSCSITGFSVLAWPFVHHHHFHTPPLCLRVRCPLAAPSVPWHPMA